MQSLKNKSLFSVFIFFYGVVLRIMEELEYNRWLEICDSQRFETGARVSKKFLLRMRSCIRLHTANYGERRKGSSKNMTNK